MPYPACAAGHLRPVKARRASFQWLAYRWGATVSQPKTQVDLDLLSINTIRTLAIDAVQQANSGHPGAPMGLAPVAYALWQRFLRYDPADPVWPNRDRLVLSN